MTFLRTALTGATLLAFTTVSALAANSENGRKLARKYSVCHGKEGIAKDPSVPNLAGQSVLYLE